MDTSAVSWDEIGNHVKGLSQARLVRAAESAAKRAILSGSDSVSTSALITSLRELRQNPSRDGILSWRYRVATWVRLITASW